MCQSLAWVAQGNIFGVAWLPSTSNREVITGAMDYTGAAAVIGATGICCSLVRMLAAWTDVFSCT